MTLNLVLGLLLAAASPAQESPASQEPPRHEQVQQQKQQPTQTEQAPAVRLPLNLTRLHRRLQEAETRPPGRRIDLTFTVHVIEEAPPLNLFTPNDNLRWGQPRYYPPIHKEMMQVISPRWVRH